MAVLQCEICGGKLIGKPGGGFECDSCGMEYSTEWAKAKVQEIRGTVQIEGPVQVEGAVKIEGGANTDSLLKRGKLALEDENWDEAKALFQEALKIEPERAEGYMGLAMAKYFCSSWDTFMPYCLHYCCGEIDDNYIRRAYQFATPELRSQFLRIKETFKKRIPLLEEKREALLPVSQLIFANQFRIIMTPLDGTAIIGCDYSEDNRGQTDISKWNDIVEVAAGAYHTVGLRTDGTVIATAFQADHYMGYDGQCDVTGWTDIVSISAGACHTVALKLDGTVVATGHNGVGQCDVRDWRDVIAIATGTNHTIGLKSDGTVIATGYNDCGQCNVHQWKNIVSIVAGGSHTIALKSNGTVLATGNGSFGECAVSGWQDIVMIATGNTHTVGLKLDGTVIAVGHNVFGQCEVSRWGDIIFIAAGGNETLGLKEDGSVVITGLSSWRFQSVKLFSGIRPIKPKKTEMLERKTEIHNRKQAELKKERISLQKELENLKGLFSGGKRRDLETRLAQIEEELNAL